MTSSTVNGHINQLSICVFCGAGEGNDPIFVDAARDLAELFKANDWNLGTIVRRRVANPSLWRRNNRDHGRYCWKTC